MRIDNPSISGSLSFIGGTNSISATSVSLTGSLSGTFEGAFSSTATANISGAFDSVSQSLASDISLNRSSINSLNSASSSYLLNTTDTLDGDLTVTGTITAQEFHTEFVSASIIYQSGSTKFGDTSDDNHDFTGSVSIASGSLQVWQTTSSKYLNIFGGNSGNFIDSYGADLYLRADGNSNNSLIIFNSGNVRAHRNFYVDENVGIGTTSPGVKLTVLENVANFASTITNSNSSGQGVQITGGNGTSNVLQLRNYLGGEVMRVQGNSTIGIGTTDPQTNLLSIRGFGAIDSNANQGLVLSSNHYYDSGDKYIGNGYASIISQDTGGSYAGFIRFQQAGLNSSGAGAAMTLSNSMVIDSSGNVGIGSISPEEKLDVAGSILINNNEFYKAENTSGTNYKIAGLTSGNVIQIGAIDYTTAGTVFAGGDNVSITTGGASGTTRLYINSSGNIGIGTSSPDAKFHIKHANTFPGLTVEADAGNEQIVIKRYSNPNEQLIFGFHSSDYARIQAVEQGVSYRPLALNQDGGNVGIGTSNPGAKLDVDGNIIAGGGNSLISGTGLFTTSTIQLHNGTAAANNIDRMADIVLANNTSYTDGILGRIIAVNSSLTSEEKRNAQISFSNDGATNSGNIAFSTTDAGTFSTKMIIKGNGNIGIGTTSPGAKFHIYQSGDISNLFDETAYGVRIGQTSVLKTLNLGYSDTYNAGVISAVHQGVVWKNLIINPASGTKLGVGTNSPGNTLHVNSGTTNVVAQFESTDATGGIMLKDSSGNVELTTSGTNGFNIQPGGGSTVFRVDGDGNVGIGTTSPSEKLTIFGGDLALRGDSYSSIGLYTTSGTNFGITNRYTDNRLSIDAIGTGELVNILSNGNVGIGTTTPSQLLHLLGTNAANNGITIQNTNSSGNSQVRFLNTSGTERAAITYVNSTDAVYHYTAGGGNVLNLVAANVGIGTTLPNAKFHIEGPNNGSTPLVNLVATGTGTFQRGVRMLNSGMNAGDHIMYAVGQADNARNMGQFYFQYNGDGSTTNRVSMGLHSVDDVLNILGTGNVGIGTTSPAGALHVYNGGSERFLIDGDVKIAGSTDLYITGASRRIVFSSGNGTIRNSTANDLLFQTNGANTRMAIKSNGTVGVGTDSPSGQFHSYISATRYFGHNVNSGDLSVVSDNNSAPVFKVQGTGTADLVNILDNTSQVFTIKDGGNVGIGTTSPSADLHIKDTDGAAIVYQGDKRGKMIGKTIQRGTVSNPKTDLFTINSFQTSNSNLYAVVTVLYVSPVTANGGKASAQFLIDDGNQASPTVGSFTHEQQVGSATISLEWDNTNKILKFLPDSANYWYYVLDVEYVAFDGASVTFNTGHSSSET